jgi:hypothetical protein
MAGGAGVDADIKISKPNEWAQLRAKDLNAIVDPMVFRAGDIFLRGHRTATDTLTTKDPEAIWKALSKDLQSVQAFFDQIILADRLPLIDYGTTFDSALNYYDSPRVCQVVNEELQDQFVYTVHVHDEASASARDAALEAMTMRPGVSSELRSEIVDQLDVVDYEWRPYLGRLEDGLSEDELKLARFVYGGLLFNAFCQMSGGTHVLQGQRGRLATAFAVNLPFDTAEPEKELLEELNGCVATLKTLMEDAARGTARRGLRPPDRTAYR